MRALLLVSLVAGLAGCGGDRSAPLPAPLQASVLPGLAPRDRDLPTDVLVTDAFAPDELRTLLDDGGYAGGREREFSGHTDTFDHVVARTLRFDDPAGAAAYLDWVAAHTLDLVGRTRLRVPLAVGRESLLFELEPCSTCKKQLPTLVAVWRRGGAVGYVLASGRNADRGTVGPLAAKVDASLS